MPEQGLIIAVLQDAIDCVAKFRDAEDHPGRSLWNETMGWFFAEDSDWSLLLRVHLFSSRSRCERHAPRPAPAGATGHPVSHEVKKTLRKTKGLEGRRRRGGEEPRGGG